MRIKFRQVYDGPAGSFSPGDMADLDTDTAINICNAGLAFPVKEKKVETQMAQFPKEVGGGWHELSNGTKVQGKEKAVEEEQKIQSRGG